MKKRLLVMMVFVLFIVAIILPVTTVKAAADTNLILQKLVRIRANEYPDGKVFESGGFEGGWQCFGFAKKISWELFGLIPRWSYDGTPLEDLYKAKQLNKGNYNETNMRGFISQALPGDIIQADVGSNDVQHTMIFCWTNANDTFTVYDANVNGDNKVYMREIKYSRWSIKTWNHLTLLRSSVYPEVNTDITSPTISNVQITDLNSEGYTVNCTVSDDRGVTRVAFPTWTNNNGQDDLIWKDGTLNGNTASYRVHVSDHNNEEGQYTTHIYAYDAAGNNSVYGVGSYVTFSPPSNVEISIAQPHFALNENVTFNFSAIGAINYTIGIDKDSIRIDTSNLGINSSYTRSFNEPGNYSTYVTAANSNGYVDSTRIYFTVGNDYIPVKSTIYNGKTYSLYRDNLTWYQAKAFCEQMGGHLATITSADEQNKIKELAVSGDNPAYWLGASDEGRAVNDFAWLTGEPFTFTSWISGEPNNLNSENFLEMRKDSYWNWNDRLASNLDNMGFICEIDGFTVSFDSAGGSNLATTTALNNDIISKPPSPIRFGYTLEGWYKEISCTNAWDFATDKVTADTTLYAKWIDICDINNDGEVSILDLALVAEQFNMKNTESSFDFNKDNKVDIFDLVICSKRVK